MSPPPVFLVPRFRGFLVCAKSLVVLGVHAANAMNAPLLSAVTTAVVVLCMLVLNLRWQPCVGGRHAVNQGRSAFFALATWFALVSLGLRLYLNGSGAAAVPIEACLGILLTGAPVVAGAAWLASGRLGRKYDVKALVVQAVEAEAHAWPVHPVATVAALIGNASFAALVTYDVSCIGALPGATSSAAARSASEIQFDDVRRRRALQVLKLAARNSAGLHFMRTRAFLPLLVRTCR